MPELWCAIPEAPGYEASSLGRVRSSRRGSWHVLAQSIDPKGYPRVGVTLKDGRYRTKTVAYWVCVAFHGPRPSPTHQVAHEDGVRSNSIASNLSWKTPKENMADRERHGRAPRGELCGMAVLSDQQADEIRARYVRGSGRWHRGNTAALAEEYGVSMDTVWSIATGRARTYGEAV